MRKTPSAPTDERLEPCPHGGRAQVTNVKRRTVLMSGLRLSAASPLIIAALPTAAQEAVTQDSAGQGASSEQSSASAQGATPEQRPALAQGAPSEQRPASAQGATPEQRATSDTAVTPTQPRRSKEPQVGDKLSFMSGPKQGKEISPADLEPGAAPVLAYAMDPNSGQPLVSRAGLLTLVRLAPEALQPASAKHAADGIVAFSALCTHAGCPVTMLHESKTQLLCNCHGSIFDAANRGAVTQGPATRRLALLPLAVRDGALVVAGKFDGPLGPPT